MHSISSTMKEQAVLTILLSIIIQNAESASRIDPLVDTKVGLIRGLRATDGDYAAFTGIPYATVDEINPFGPAIPHPAFDDVFEAYGDSKSCPQIDLISSSAAGNLDCLQLNVYVPNTASSINRLPVLVWIHGGGFVGGDSRSFVYGPRYLVQHDVILVTINYRLGPYGFMCLNIPQVPGNQGLKDQQLALKWVKDNIEAFGGNNNKITIFGESAGGVSVDLHLHFSERKFFNKVIMQSGSALGPWGVLEPDLESANKLANHLGLKTNNVKDALSFLSKTDPKLVIAATDELDLLFRPCVEGDFDGVEKFMGVHPINTEISRNDYSILIGHNDDESSILLRYNRDLEFIKGLIDLYLVDYFNFEADELAENVQLIKHFYVGDEDISEEFIQPIIDFDSDMIFNYPTARSILKYLNNNANSVYHYLFSYNGGRNLAKKAVNETKGGAAHADELGYLFSQTYDTDAVSSEDQIVIDRLSTLWTNFAKYGNPTPETNELLPVLWPPVTKDTFSYLSIDEDLDVKRRPFHSRMAFLDLFYKINEKAQKGYQEN